MSRLPVLGVALVVGLLIAGCGRQTATPAPTPVSDPAAARDAALAYVAAKYGRQTPPPDAIWTVEKKLTPEGMVGVPTNLYTAGDWVVRVTWPVSENWTFFYTLKIENRAAGFLWEGEITPDGQVTERN